MRKRNHILFISLFFTILLLLASCSNMSDSKNTLDPDQPISITLWHYYSGQTKAAFDELVNEFNTTVGFEKGIVVDAQSHGEITQLETAVFNAANRNIGAERLPDIFAAYPENAYRVNQLVELVDFQRYFNEEELAQFHPDFISSGKFVGEDELKILPIAKSTENLFLNKTTWDEFAQATGASLDDLATWEGVAKTAKSYYEYSGGKAFLGLDSLSNFFLVASSQLGQDLVQEENGQIRFNLEEKIARKIWEAYYIPYINGHFTRQGRFSSDDAKIGVTIGYIGSTAGAVYFPTEVTLNSSNVFPIENITLPFPVFSKAQPYAVEQGAGMVMVKSNEKHEFAAAEFLKWFTSEKQNSKFAVSTAYFPVKSSALKSEAMDASFNVHVKDGTPAVKNSIDTTIKMFEEYKLISSKAFDGSFEIRSHLNTHLQDFISKDIAQLSKATNEERATLLQEFQSEDHFINWYNSFMQDVQNILK